MRRVLVLSMYDDIPHFVRQDVEKFLVDNESWGDRQYCLYSKHTEKDEYPHLHDYLISQVGADLDGNVAEVVYILGD